MYRRLLAELVLRGMDKKDLAGLIPMPYTTLLDKINGKTSFTLDEVWKIKKALDSELDAEVLFEKFE